MKKEIINIVPVNQQLLSEIININENPSHMLSQEILLDTTESLCNLGLLEEDMHMTAIIVKHLTSEKGANINDI